MSLKTREEVEKEFEEYFVEMHPMYGHDMYNRPILYEMQDDKVADIKSFLHTQRLQDLEAVEEMVREMERIIGYNQIVNDFLSLLSEAKKKIV